MGNIEHWADPSVESMYDKTLLAMEIGAIERHVSGRVCDAGCGEGEGTARYAMRGQVVAFDVSPVRLAMARKRCPASVTFHEHNVLERFGGLYQTVISQRLLVNLSSWVEQKTALDRLCELVADGGSLVLSEGSQDGVNALNALRGIFGLAPIPVPAHNVFLKDDDLLGYADEAGLSLESWDDFGAYYLLTRGIQPALRQDFHWGSAFNSASADERIKHMLLDTSKFSRIKVWVFERERV